MGGLCNCNAKNEASISQFTPIVHLDPRLSELQTMLKILDSKLNSNLTSIEDFKLLLSETRKEPIFHKDIVDMLKMIEEGFEDAKNALIQVTTKKNITKQQMEVANTKIQNKLHKR